MVHVNEFTDGLAVEENVQTAIKSQVEDLKQEGLDAKFAVADIKMGGVAAVIAEIAANGGW